MGLKQTFEAADILPFNLWDGVQHDISYNQYLITEPRCFDEEPYAYHLPGTSLGMIWTERQDNPYSDAVINCYSTMALYHWPSWGARRWTIDGDEGHLISTASGSTATGDFAVTYGRFTFEPAGYVWEFNGHPFIDNGGAILLDSSTMTVDSSVTLLPSAFAGHESDSIERFAIDRAHDRVFIRWNSDSTRLVNLYSYSTKELLHQVYAPNDVEQIVVTDDGFVYVADAQDWLMVYDYDGVFHGGYRHPRAEEWPAGYVWGWDKFKKRLLFLAGTALQGDGDSTLRVQAFYPVPQEAILTPAIPREVPRKGRTVTFFARLTGDGGEPLSGRVVQQSGTTSQTGTTDREGDVLLQVTPQTTGEIPVTLTVD